MSTSTCERCNHTNAAGSRFCLQCGAMLEMESTGDPLLGKILLGRYRVEKVLGEGGMGKVYLATQKMGTAQRKVAIKTLQKALSGDPQIVARFHRECETVIGLHHPNTVKFYDFGEMEDGTLFIVMEYIEGGDLSHRLEKKGPISAELADRLIVQVCGSLHEAHESGVVHRDLKPENVLLTMRGGQKNFVKVLDFGIAKRSEAEDKSAAKLTQQGTVLGTPPYMSPEQFSGQTLDLRSDIYSLGVMTYEMLTGHLPFTANTPREWATKHLTAQPTPIENYPQGAALSQEKRNAIMKAMSKDKGERQPNAIAFMQEFTGMGDPQMAWTVATSTGVSGNTPSPSQTPHPSQGGTPNPSYGGQQNPSYGGQQNPSYGGQQNPSYGGQPYAPGHTGSYEPPKRGFPWLLVGGLITVLVLAVGGSVFAWSQGVFDGEATVTNPPNNPPNNPPVTTNTNTDPNPLTDNGTLPVNGNVGQPIAPPETLTMTEPVNTDPDPDTTTETDPDPDTTETENTQTTMRTNMRTNMRPSQMTTSEMTTSEMTTEMTTNTEMTTTSEMTQNSQSVDEASGQRSLQAAQIFARQGQIRGAISSLRSAQRYLGSNNPDVTRVRTQVVQAAGLQVSTQIQRGECQQAANNIRALESIGLGNSLRRQLAQCR